MTEFELQILDIIQDGFPIAERPYAAIAEVFAKRYDHLDAADVREQQVFEAVEGLRSSGVIRRIGGVYDSRKLGYTSRLCCGIVQDDSDDENGSAMDRFASVVNEIPAITHNYVRSHQYNVWFTVIGKSEQEIQDVVHDLEQRTNLIDTHILNSKRMFKINTVMKNAVSAPGSNPVSQDVIASCATTKQSNAVELPESDRARIHLLSGDIPHSLTPFTDLQTNPDDFLSAIKEDLSSKRMRRFGAILRHQQAGFAENAMVCFCIGLRDVSEAGAILAAESFVSHCYEREAFEAFPYNVYAMVHASSSEDLLAKIQTLVRKLNNPEYAVLHSVRELKKTSFRF